VNRTVLPSCSVHANHMFSLIMLHVYVYFFASCIIIFFASLYDVFRGTWF
jgi:hypothetical protein